MSDTAAFPPSSRPSPAWGLLAAVWVVLAVTLAGERYIAHRQVTALEHERLSQKADGIADHLALQIEGVDSALLNVRDDLPRWPVDVLATAPVPRLRALSEAMPIVRTMVLVNAEGRVVSSSRDALLGADVSARAFFSSVRDQLDASRLYVAPPYRGTLGVTALNLSRAVVGPGGEFRGLVVATLDPDYVEATLRSALYARDGTALVAHGDGLVLSMAPRDAYVADADLSAPGTLFRRHRDAGDAPEVLVGRDVLTGRAQMSVQRLVQSRRLPMTRPLVVALTRDVGAVYAPWRRDTATAAALYVLFVATTGYALTRLRRREREMERVIHARAVQERRDAERLRLALRGADLGLWDLHVPSGRTVVNERWKSMLGLAPDAEASAAQWASLVHPDDWPRVKAAQDAHQRGESDRYESIYRIRHADGRWLWLLDRGQVTERDTAGQPLRMVGTHLDITEQMLSQQALQRSEQSLAITLQSIGDAVIATDAQGCVTRMNPTAERLTGWAATKAVGRPLSTVFRIVDARTRQPVVDPVRAVLDRGEVVGLAEDTLLIARDGLEREVADTAAPIRNADGRTVGVVLVFSDVTERKRAADALRDSEHKLRVLFETLDVGVVVHAPDTQVLQANPAAGRILGLTPEQMRGRQAIDPAWTFVEQDGSPMPPSQFPISQVISSGRPLRRMLGGVRRPDLDEPLWVQVDATPLFDIRGELQQVVVTFADVSERRRSEQQLQAAQAALQATLSTLPDLLFVLDLDGRIQELHAPSGESLATPPVELAGRHLRDLLSDDAAEVVLKAVRQAHVHGSASGAVYELSTPQGRRWFELSVARQPLPPDSPPRFTTLARDVSERIRAEAERLALEQRLREAQKMEAIGTLAGGIAHDFNNILASILGNVGLAREDLGADHPAQALLAQVHRSGVRARDLVQQILTFSRRQPQQLRRLPLQPVVREAMALLRATLPAGVRLDLQLAAAPVEVDADATQLQQVLINLCTNAWHALPASGGHIEVGLELATCPLHERASDDGSPHARCAHLWVRDNGSGMDAATRERIFDPFFTTKPVGQGTGLGLAVVHGIVQAHHGAITLDTAPGDGSCFHVWLPLPVAPPPAPADAAEGSRAPRGAGERVVYIDDDEVMLALVERLLQRAGYRASVFASPVKALHHLEADPHSADLVITDHNMPEMSGLELARRLSRLRPDLPLVLSSGYLSDALRVEAERLGVRALLHKEQTFERLTATVEQVLATSRR